MNGNGFKSGTAVPGRRHATTRQGCLLAALGIGLLVGCTPSEDSETQRETPRVVDTYRVTAADGLSRVNFSGRVVAAERTSLSFEIPGEIRRVAVDVGDSFESDDTLAVLEDARYQLVHDRAVAAEEESKARLEEARLAFSRQRQLREKGYSSQSNFDAVKASLDSARSRQASAIADRRLAARDLELTKLRAPFAGSVSQRRVEPSERVNTNQTVLEVISDREGYEVETSVPESLVGRLRVGSTQTITVSALEDESLSGTIKHLGTQPRSANNYPVVLAIRESVAGLRSGMTAQVQLNVGSPEAGAGEASVVRIPLTALIHDSEARVHVLRVDSEQRLEKVDLKIVEVQDKMALVTGELRPDDLVVARGAEFVAPGETVAILGRGPARYN